MQSGYDAMGKFSLIPGSSHWEAHLALRASFRSLSEIKVIFWFSFLLVSFSPQLTEFRAEKGLYSLDHWDPDDNQILLILESGT